MKLHVYKVVPNYGKRGGSREPGAYLSFLLDFYHNLPRVMVFAQDDTPKLPSRLASLSVVDMEALHAPLVRPNRSNCLCNHVLERFYAKGEYHWFHHVQTLRAAIFGRRHHRQTDRLIAWPSAASFMVTSEHVRLRPVRVYSNLYRFFQVDEVCPRIGRSLEFAHAMERTWFDPSLRAERDFSECCLEGQTDDTRLYHADEIRCALRCGPAC